MTTTWWQVVILGVIFVGGALWLAKKVIQAVVSLFSGDRDDDSQGLPRHSHTHQERRALRDSSQRHYTHSGPSVQRYNLPTGGTRTSDHGTHASASSQKISAYKISPPVDLSDFLPIYDRQSYEAARAEARRLQNLKDGHLTRQRRAAERQGRRFDVHHYKDIIDTLGDNIDRLNAESSAWIYQENNQPGKVPADSVDLHNLGVVEGIKYAQAAIRDARAQGKKKLRLIVGQGRHSDGGISKLKPAVVEALRRGGEDVELDRRNAGVLVLRLP